MATLADNKRDFLLGQGIANGDLARMEKTYYEGLSGLSNPESYSIIDHKRAFFKTFLGLDNASAGVLSISDLERQYLSAPVNEPLATAWNDFYSLHTAIKAPGTPLVWFDSRYPLGFDVALPAADAQISQWNDLSGNTRHAAQGTPGLRPLFKRPGHLDIPGVRFDGTDDTLTFTLPETANPFTVYVVARPTNGTATGVFFLGKNNAFGGAFYTVASSPFLRMWGGTLEVAPTAVLTSATDSILVTGIWNDSSTTVFMKGVQGSTVNDSTGVLGATSQLGAENTSNYYPGDLYSILVYAGAHNTATRQSIERALGAVYGIGVA